MASNALNTFLEDFSNERYTARNQVHPRQHGKSSPLSMHTRSIEGSDTCNAYTMDIATTHPPTVDAIKARLGLPYTCVRLNVVGSAQISTPAVVRRFSQTSFKGEHKQKTNKRNILNTKCSLKQQITYNG